MILQITIDEKNYSIEIPQDVLDEGESFFEMMDLDMDQGWQMSREYVRNPNVKQRCQIVADRLLTAILNENTQSLLLMAGYIVKHLSDLESVDIDTTGNMHETRFFFKDVERINQP